MPAAAPVYSLRDLQFDAFVGFLQPAEKAGDTGSRCLKVDGAVLGLDDGRLASNFPVERMENIVSSSGRGHSWGFFANPGDGHTRRAR